MLSHARTVAQLGSPFIATVLESAIRQLDAAPRTAACVDAWGGDPLADALAMRLNAGLHAVARSGRVPAMSALYANLSGDFDTAIREALTHCDGMLLGWLAKTPQTNEVGRAAALLAALTVLASETGYPCELLEVGTSAGLNLNLAHYRYRLGALEAGDPASQVEIAPAWQGGALPHVPVAVRRAEGVDLDPLDAADPAVRERLLSYVWADEPFRAHRLARALDLATCLRPQVVRDDALHWLEQRLAEPQAAGISRVVFHSMVLQYLSGDKRAAFLALMARVGTSADPARPLAWISFEWTEDRSRVLLQLTVWPRGTTRTLAECHPYGNWIRWLN